MSFFSTRFSKGVRIFTVLASLSLVSGLALAELSYSNKWRIECSEGANSDGQIVFTLTPKGYKPFTINADIKKGTSENNVADKVREAFKAQLPKTRFAIEVDDGEDVLVKRKGSTPEFALELVSNSAEGVRINIEKE